MIPTKRITMILGSLVATLAGLGSAQQFGLGDGYTLLPADPCRMRSYFLKPPLKSPRC